MSDRWAQLSDGWPIRNVMTGEDLPQKAILRIVCQKCNGPVAQVTKATSGRELRRQVTFLPYGSGNVITKAFELDTAHGVREARCRSCRRGRGRRIELDPQLIPEWIPEDTGDADGIPQHAV